jgi:hypothetical protein
VVRAGRRTINVRHRGWKRDEGAALAVVVATAAAAAADEEKAPRPLNPSLLDLHPSLNHSKHLETSREPFRPPLFSVRVCAPSGAPSPPRVRAPTACEERDRESGRPPSSHPPARAATTAAPPSSGARRDLVAPPVLTRSWCSGSLERASGKRKQKVRFSEGIGFSLADARAREALVRLTGPASRRRLARDRARTGPTVSFRWRHSSWWLEGAWGPFSLACTVVERAQHSLLRFRFDPCNRAPSLARPPPLPAPPRTHDKAAVRRVGPIFRPGLRRGGRLRARGAEMAAAAPADGATASPGVAPAGSRFAVCVCVCLSSLDVPPLILLTTFSPPPHVHINNTKPLQATGGSFFSLP